MRESERQCARERERERERERASDAGPARQQVRDRSGFQGSLGFRVQVLEFRVLGCRAYGSGLCVLEFRDGLVNKCVIALDSKV